MAYEATQGAGHPIELTGWRKYFSFNTDHKVIGIQYLVTASRA